MMTSGNSLLRFLLVEAAQVTVHSDPECGFGQPWAMMPKSRATLRLSHVSGDGL
ncbi:MAG: hypothetical protein ACLQEI_01130 [Terriglobales bacterium]